MERYQAEYADTISLLASIESGLVTISMSEYKNLTPRFIRAWSIFKKELDEHRARNKGN